MVREQATAAYDAKNVAERAYVVKRTSLPDIGDHAELLE
jgi:hypothetical protein